MEHSPSSRINRVEPVAYPHARTRRSFELDGSINIPSINQWSWKDEEFHGQQWPQWTEIENDMELKKEMKGFLVKDKGWRTHAQAADNLKSSSRQGRVDRHLAQQALYRIFADEHFDMKYPWQTYIPQGEQEVPRIRGFMRTADTEARVYYYANRIFRVEKLNEISPHDAVKSIVPNFWNLMLLAGSGESPEEKTFAAQFLYNLLKRFELKQTITPRAVKLADKFEVHKPESMSRQEWVKNFQWFI